MTKEKLVDKHKTSKSLYRQNRLSKPSVSIKVNRKIVRVRLETQYLCRIVFHFNNI